MQVRFQGLGEAAVARIRSVEIEAEEVLSKDLIHFLGYCWNGGVRTMGRNPSSSDLLPPFEKYGQSVFDAVVKERIGSAVGHDRVPILNTVLRQVVQSIISKQGVWARVVTRACRYVDIGGWENEFGTFNPSAFSRPAARQLRTSLQLHAKQWEWKGWDQKAALATAKTKLPTKQPAFPGRAGWFTQKLKERSWTVAKLAAKSDIDPKTARKALGGAFVTDRTLESIAEGLSKYKTLPVISVADIPNQ
jgi:hypothetical protein